MGLTLSNVSSNVKQQAEGSAKRLYELADLAGGGSLIKLMRDITRLPVRQRNYDELYAIFEQKVKTFLYNDGEGCLIPVEQLVLRRNKERPRHPIKLKHKASGNVSNGHYDAVRLNMKGRRSTKTAKFGFREVCWRLDEIGSVGESLLHICFLVASPTHYELAKHLLKRFPKLINDIYLSEEYYGENVLHMAIVNEDPAMVKYLLDLGVNYHERSNGNFFTPDDQKESRRDNIRHEWADLKRKTNYEGFGYFGEYPLSFAATLHQEECVRLLLAKGADPNKPDTNGNTVMHMLVIYSNVYMFDLLKDSGGRLDIKNVNGLTPLTLAAQLAKKEMLQHILKVTRKVEWTYGDVQCAAFPLQDLDTIDTNTGYINHTSLLNLIVYGERAEHLEMLEGIVEDLLKEKWETFVRHRYIKQFLFFAVYLICMIVSSLIRPGYDRNMGVEYRVEFLNGSSNATYHQQYNLSDSCYLLRDYDSWQRVRWGLECVVVLGSIGYTFMAFQEIYHESLRLYLQTLMRAPAKCLFQIGCFLVLLMIPLRAACSHEAEDYLAILSVLLTGHYLLFFGRGMKLIGPFVVMIYKMIIGDLLRFILIFIVFVTGFSQGFRVVFSHAQQGISTSQNLNNPLESIIVVFLMAIGEFIDIANELESPMMAAFKTIGQILLYVYLILANVLLINMLIAMMGNTYTIINEAVQENFRQWAKIILILELSFTPTERLQHQKNSLTESGERAYIQRWRMTEEEMEQSEQLD